jgi:dUTP pyrophosphatase
MAEFDLTTTQNPNDEKYVNQFCFTHMACNYALLKLAVSPDEPELLELYKQHVDAHNKSGENDAFPNSGFDLFIPKEYRFRAEFQTQMVDLKVKTEMIYCDKNIQGVIETEDGQHVELQGGSYTCAYYLYPRSSLSKLPLMLANHVGIIDSGYRGSLMAAVRKFPVVEECVVEKNTRLFQLCHPTLCPIFVVLVDESELNRSERGAGGFGSTGAVGLTTA